jgi:hypothetical protein
MNMNNNEIDWSQFGTPNGVSPIILWTLSPSIPEIIRENGIEWKVILRYDNGNVIVSNGKYRRYIILHS